jgi:hypothetical protein
MQTLKSVLPSATPPIIPADGFNVEIKGELTWMSRNSEDDRG